MRIGRPSPSMIVASTALVVALGGTATAATVVINSSSQIRQGSVTSSDVRNGSLTQSDIKDGTLTSKQLSSGLQRSLSGTKGSSVAAPGGLVATEAVRKAGPENVSGSARIATLPELAAGTYLLTAKTTISPLGTGIGLGEALRPNKAAGAECILEAGGDQDNARGIAVNAGGFNPHTLNMQLTRTIGSPTNVTVTCNMPDFPWRATDTSIVAVKLQSSNRVESTG